MSDHGPLRVQCFDSRSSRLAEQNGIVFIDEIDKIVRYRRLFVGLRRHC